MFTQIAIFVLATTKTLNYPQRLLQITDTWGRYFPHLYFVFGRNVVDFNFLENRCRIAQHERRSLIARDPQTPSADKVVEYECFQGFRALFIANCTGEYFGIGPTCRCQEAMRWFYNSPSTSAAEWFVFIDDDIYFRPHSLRELLFPTSKRLDITMYKHPMALVSPEKYRGFRAAMEVMRDSIVTKNMLTKLHDTWGGSHDSLLGTLLWIHSIPTYSFAWSYFGGEPFLESILDVMNIIKRDSQFIIHKARNFKLRQTMPKMVPSSSSSSSSGHQQQDKGRGKEKNIKGNKNRERPRSRRKLAASSNNYHPDNVTRNTIGTEISHRPRPCPSTGIQRMSGVSGGSIKIPQSSPSSITEETLLTTMMPAYTSNGTDDTDADDTDTDHTDSRRRLAAAAVEVFYLSFAGHREIAVLLGDYLLYEAIDRYYNASIATPAITSVLQSMNGRKKNVPRNIPPQLRDFTLSTPYTTVTATTTAASTGASSSNNVIAPGGGGGSGGKGFLARDGSSLFDIDVRAILWAALMPHKSYEELLEEQVRYARKGIARLIRLLPSGVNRTVYGKYGYKGDDVFAPKHCKVIS